MSAGEVTADMMRGQRLRAGPEKGGWPGRMSPGAALSNQTSLRAVGPGAANKEGELLAEPGTCLLIFLPEAKPTREKTPGGMQRPEPVGGSDTALIR